MNNLPLSIGKGNDKVLNLLYLLFLFFSVLAIINEQYVLLIIPTVALSSVYFIRDMRLAYYLMIMSVPVSIEYSFGNLSLDTPDELFNIAFLFILPGFLMFNYKKLDFGFIRHPIVLMLSLLFVISIISTIFSVNHVLSFKYLLAKAWYIVGYLSLIHI